MGKKVKKVIEPMLFKNWEVEKAFRNEWVRWAKSLPVRPCNYHTYWEVPFVDYDEIRKVYGPMSPSKASDYEYSVRKYWYALYEKYKKLDDQIEAEKKRNKEKIRNQVMELTQKGIEEIVKAFEKIYSVVFEPNSKELSDYTQKWKKILNKYKNRPYAVNNILLLLKNEFNTIFASVLESGLVKEIIDTKKAKKIYETLEEADKHLLNASKYITNQAISLIEKNINYFTSSELQTLDNETRDLVLVMQGITVSLASKLFSQLAEEKPNVKLSPIDGEGFRDLGKKLTTSNLDDLITYIYKDKKSNGI